MNALHKFRNELKARRLDLRLKQKDMFDRTGLSRQQYQHIEKNGNPTLETLILIAEGLNCELKLIPKNQPNIAKDVRELTQNDPTANPWQDLLD